ncbi:transmembrane protein 181-like isoform X4 [Ptychodera flava]|uniref:transmembrane protein 181-like isoform X3 n=1 Tax=Ptychodera flava TaxID=63121 RepID=UPI00396A7D58
MDNLGYTSYHSPSWIAKLRSALLQFTGLFSAFESYIAPQYHHDRVYRSVQMRLYTLTKRQFVVVFGAFFVCFFITVLIGVAGPPLVDSYEQNASQLVPEPDNLAVGPFHLKSPTLSTFNQQLWLVATPQLKHAKGEVFAKNFLMSVEIHGQDVDTTVHSLGEQAHNRTRWLRCGETCETFIVLHLPYLDYTNYLIILKFYDLENLENDMKEIVFHFHTYYPSFTQVEIWFRFVFLVLTFIVTCLFAHSLRKFSMRDWSFEQKWMSLLLPLLLLYNNPIFPLTFLVNSWVPIMMDNLFQATFLSALLLFWLCSYHAVRQSERRFLPFYVPKMIITGILWLTAFCLATYQQYHELQDPTFQYKVDTGGFLGLKIFFFVIGSIYLLYLVFLVVRAYTELRSMPYFDLRLKFMTALMFCVVAISITIMALRFGTGVLDPNFVPELSTHYRNSAEFLAFFGLLNFYLYTMAYVYSPSKNASTESHFKDNPTFSMLNESDDEIVYGREREDTGFLAAF